MKFSIFVIILVGYVGTANATNCATQIGNINDLDASTAQELIVQCEQKKLLAAQEASNSVVSITKPDGTISTEKLSEWGKIAQEFAKALGIAAKEMGIAIDDFLGTTAGKLTAIIIIYHVMGEAILGIFLGIPLMFVSWYVGYKLFKFISVKDYEQKTVRTWRGEKIVNIPTYNSISDMSDNEVGALWFISISEIILTGFIMFVIIT